MPKKIFLYPFAAFLTALAVFMAGCGPLAIGVSSLEDTETFTPQSSAEARASSKFDACKLMTKADAEQILGDPVDSPTNPLQEVRPIVWTAANTK